MDSALIISLLGFALVWTLTCIGFATWLQTQFKNNRQAAYDAVSTARKEIMADFDKKHQANELTMKAMEKLVMRHDFLLDPEFTDQAAALRVRNGTERVRG